MAEFKLKGNPFHTVGALPAVGSTAPSFTLTKTDLSEVTLDDLRGKRIVLNVFPSIDTDVCAASVRRFNAEADKLADTVVLCASMDLPFAHKGDVHVKRIGNDLVVRVNGSRRTLALPPALSDYQPTGAALTDGVLHVTFDRPDPADA
mgnify:CR=1 FL=1